MWPPGFAAFLIFYTACSVLFGNGGDHRRVQTARQQYAIWHVGHQVAFHRVFQRVAQGVGVGDVVFNRVVIEPVTLVIFADLTVLAPQVAACREFFDGTANRHQRFHFRSHIQVAEFIMPHVQRDNAQMVAANQVGVFLGVVQGKGEHALQVVEEVGAFFLIQRQDHLTVGTSLELIAIAKLLAQRLVVVNFTVNRQNVGVRSVVQRLGAIVDVDNRQALMHQNGFIAGVNAGPVRAAVAHQTRQLQRFLTQFNGIGLQIEHTENRTHIPTLLTTFLDCDVVLVVIGSMVGSSAMARFCCVVFMKMRQKRQGMQAF
ncbi:hypothetical protein D3C79_195740 [compost metagenome]